MNGFIAGGTLPAGAGVYVEREADRRLHESLRSGRLAYVLDARQVGKSSLIAHTARALEQEGRTSVRIDLQRIGTNVTLEQWYGTMLAFVADALGHREEALAIWASETGRGALNRWFFALETLYLPRLTQPVVIFLDEIDFVLALPFPTDEFFAGIRDWMTRVGGETINFCLVGVASPQDLIARTEVTPFNIGDRVVLTDFSRADLRVFEALLPRRTLDCIHRWTGGHPYLTQLLGSLVLAEGGSVDAVVRKHLTTGAARTDEPHFADIARRLTSGKTREEQVSVLDAYRRALRRGVLADEVVPETADRLFLTGLVSMREDKIEVRSPLYREVFPESWVRAQMPKSEVQRQRAAARRAARKVAWIGLAFGSVLAGLAAWGGIASFQRGQALRVADFARQQSEARAYQAAMGLASQAAEREDYRLTVSLIDAYETYPGRGWEWEYWRALTGQFTPRLWLDAPSVPNRASPVWFEGETLHMLGPKGLFREGVRIDDISESEIMDLSLPSDFPWLGEDVSAQLRWARDVSMRWPADRVLVHGPSRSFLRVRDTGEIQLFRSDRLVWERKFADPIRTAQWSPDGARVYVHIGRSGLFALESIQGSILWKAPDLGYIACFSPDGRRAVALAAYGRGPAVIDAVHGRVIGSLGTGNVPTWVSAWLPKKNQIVSAGMDGIVRSWSAESLKEIRKIPGLPSIPSSIHYSESENRVVCVVPGGAYELNPAENTGYRAVPTLPNEIQDQLWSPTGKQIFLSSIDGTVGVVSWPDLKLKWSQRVGRPRDRHASAFSPSGSLLAVSATDGGIRIFESGGTLRRQWRDRGHAVSVGFISESKLWLCLAQGGLYHVDLESGAWSPVAIPTGDPMILAYSPDLSAFAVAMSGGATYLVEGEGPPVLVRPKDETRPTSITWSHDSARVALTTTAFNTMVVDRNRPFRPLSLVGHEGRVWGAMWSPDNQKILTNSVEGTARLWDSTTGRPLGKVSHGSWVPGVAWSPDGSRVATVSDDRRVRVCDPNTGFEYASFSTAPYTAFSVSFSPDGRSIVVTDSGGRIHRWTAGPKTSRNTSR